MVTLYDVARLAGVSTATVSRVVHGQDRVRESTRMRVRKAIEELGYVPDGAGQSLSRRRKDVIGLVCVEREVDHIDIENVGLLYYDEVLRGVEACIRHRNWSLLITFMQGYRTDFSRLDSLSGKVDGILIGEGFVASPIIERLAARVPVVVIAGTPGERAADVVAADNFSGSAAIITHLIADHGKRRLFHVDGPANSPDAGQRRLALEHVLRGHPQCQLVGSTQGILSVRSGELAGENLLARHRAALPDAVVCANDQMAIGVLRAFAAGGVRVPDDIAVVGFDDIALGSLYDPSLTTVHQPMRMLGERACTRLLDRIAEPGLAPAVELLPTELVLRASCGCPPDTVTRQAVKALKNIRTSRVNSAGRPDSAVARQAARQLAPQAAKA
ncbi:MAG TPA: LacI family DNA-binding transcriptional regulator [Streptosporangiaceae bacterium]|nr:LacI family DNA-binding transcriptional regulator [Streptosporangiaceae bacterium]